MSPAIVPLSCRSLGVCLALMVAVLMCGRGAFADGPVLTVLVHERAPYYVRDQGGFSGLVSGPIAASLKGADIPFRWREVPANRQLNLIRISDRPLCAAGWFRNPERESFALFSDPVYRDQPLVAIARVDNRRVAEHATVRELFSDQDLHLGLKLGYSYGPEVDALLKSLGTLTVITSQDNSGMVRMLLGRRFDYLLSSYEEASLLIETMGAAAEDLAEIRLAGLPMGNERYLMCSDSTPQEWIERFNQALAEVLDPYESSTGDQGS